MESHSIPIQNPCEFALPAIEAGQAFLDSSAHLGDDHACARILWAFESHIRNAFHKLGLRFRHCADYFILVFIITFMKCALVTSAQPALQFNYSYLRATEWDKILQTYNTSRPWHEQELIPLTHVYSTSFSWNVKIANSRQPSLGAREIHLLPSIGYQYCYSLAVNENDKMNVGFQQAHIGATIRTHPKCLFKPTQQAGPLGTRWYVAIGGGLSLWMPYVRLNGKSTSHFDDEKYRIITKGAYGEFATGFHLAIIGSFSITPEVSLIWYPDVELVDFAEMVNGHNLTGMRNTNDNVLFFRGGIRITYLRKTQNWWDKPRQGDKT